MKMVRHIGCKDKSINAFSNRSKAHKGRKHTPETKKKISEKAKILFNTEEYKQKQRIAHLGKKRPDLAKYNQRPEVRKKRSIDWNNRSQELKDRLKRIWNRNIKDSEFNKKRLRALLKNPNKPEKKLIELFNTHNLPYKYVGNGQILFEQKNPDFINSNGQKKIIELFGVVFHDPKRTFKKNINYSQTEHGTKAIYSKYGFKTLIIWDYELKNLHKVLDKIRKFDDESME